MWRLFFPPAESDPEVRAELAHQSRVGLTTLALIGALLAVAGLVNSTISLTTSHGVLPSDAATIAIQNQTAVLSACLLLLALRRRSLSLGTSRAAAVALVLFFGALLMRPEVLGRYAMVPAALGFIYVLGLALMPFRPMMALAFGAALTAEIALANQRVDGALDMSRTLPALLNALVAGTILTGLLYQFRRRVAEQQVEALHYRQALEDTNRELEETRLQLVQSEKMASLGNLAAGIAHEINTPMAAIKANAEMTARAIDRLERAVEDGDADAARKPFNALRSTTEVTREAVRRIVGIVRSLRSFARLDEAEEAWTDVNACVRATTPLLRHEVKDDVDLILDLAEVPAIRCHPNQINQVIMNVLLNALQAMGPKGRVTVRTRALEGDEVALTVEDEGSGIASEHLQRIFDPGFTTKGVGVGTGLGLSITYRIVQAHGGAIDVRSEPGVGTTVTVTLPRQHPDEAPR